ncbi:DNA alkylation repair protein [Candidatus Woesearchaeota archaeon]|jgi:3-methyladenine DNA glycosylase AlkD|nr:DNA alkylation repair protein [Candidatus Woesearchaeota archaeon]MBT4111170.1 DNA alkylation repair protein [Candidatus Woesearchaeota archaeon]MBT4336751.1 DNA alkylation repair protein [Candidatus Woesearchaeota archaeon]MBT4469419.1 DNA alkylation repair protein [Candidatus Woesearchaeota archaeon]MBT6744186.1 DNA alkylation repair protein [Candidatus Woesearchaeota archaeon]
MFLNICNCMLKQIIMELYESSDPVRAKHSQGFFKTGPGEYGEGDVFLGLTMPQIRVIAKKYFKEITLSFVQELVKSKYHEFRMCALVMLVYKYEKDTDSRKEIYEFFLKNTAYINNWDLVDVTIPKTVGAYLVDNDRSILYKLVKSSSLWERRISVLATFAFIRLGDFKDSLKISEILLNDKHDLIHKAVGWMLREIGKRDEKILTGFLDQHYAEMPRTMLRYSIERLEEGKRKGYLKK